MLNRKKLKFRHRGGDKKMADKDKRFKYDAQEKEMWFEERRKGTSLTEISRMFNVPVGTISSNCTVAGVYSPGSTSKMRAQGTGRKPFMKVSREAADEMARLRKEEGLTWKELGERLGVAGTTAKRYVTHYLKGRNEWGKKIYKPRLSATKKEDAPDDAFEELDTAFKGVQSAAVAFVEKRYQELLEQNAELTAKLAETKEECRRLKEVVLEERNNNGDWKERLQFF